MTPSTTIDDLLSELRKRCAKHDSALIPATFSDLETAPRLRLEWENFLLALTAENPQAVYWMDVVFDPGEYVQECMEEAGWKPAFEQSRRSRWPTLAETKAHVASDLALVAPMAGLPYYAMALYTKDGAIRSSSVLLTWAHDLSEKITAFVEQRFQEDLLLQDQEHTLAAELIERLIAEIAGNADFQRIRGLPKRLLWVQAHYADQIPQHARGRVDRPAQNVDLVDANLAYVVKSAHDRCWVVSHAKKP